jgi:XTP/dITP diphosphohydrolase
MPAPVLVVATRNAGKLKELRALLEERADARSLDDFADVPEVVEDGDTFEANAVKKAKTVARHTGHLAVADDSGLEVDALDGAPGVMSARFAGPDATDADRNRKLLHLLANTPAGGRQARFRCAIAVALPDGVCRTVEAACEGVILEAPRGQSGFGFDPVFEVPAWGRSFAELSGREKNSISHRGKALRLALPLIEALLTE